MHNQRNNLGGYLQFSKQKTFQEVVESHYRKKLGLQFMSAGIQH